MATTPGPVGADAGLPRDAWQARVVSGSLRFPTLTGVHGTLALDSGRLAFTVEGTPHPLWSVRAADVSASPLGFFASSDLELVSPETGTVHVTVSRERIGRLWAGEARGRRQRRYAEEFLAALALSGAAVGG